MTAAVHAVRQHWQLALGLAVVLVAAALVARAFRRKAEDSTREELRERRGKLAEDLLTIAVASIAAALSAHALMGFAHSTLHLNGAWRLLPFGGLDAAAVVCAIRARRRARAQVSAGVNGILVWVFAAISAVFSAGDSADPQHALTLWGAIGHGIWALVAATLWEIGLVEERRAVQARPDRRVGWIRWLHPVERLQVLAELAANTAISADEATVRVRQQRAAKALFLLNVAASAAERAQQRADDANGVARERRRTERRALRFEQRAQRAAVRVRLAEDAVHAAVMPQLRVLVDVRRIAISGGHHLHAEPQRGAAAGERHSSGGVPVSANGAPIRVNGAPRMSAPTAVFAPPSGAPENAEAASPPASNSSSAPTLPAPAPREDPLGPSTPAPVPGVPLTPPPAATSAPTPDVTTPTAPFPEDPVLPAAAPRTPVPEPTGAGGQVTQGTGAGPEWMMAGSSAVQQQTGPGARQSSVSAALQSAVIPQQAPAVPKTAEKLDPRALQILGWLDADPGLTGAEAARRLNVAVRTGQRLWRAAQDERERLVSTGQRRLHSVGEAAYAAPSMD